MGDSMAADFHTIISDAREAHAIDLASLADPASDLERYLPQDIVRSWLKSAQNGLSHADGIRAESQYKSNAGRRRMIQQIDREAAEVLDDYLSHVSLPATGFLLDRHGAPIAGTYQGSDPILAQIAACPTFTETNCGTLAATLISDRCETAMVVGNQHYLDDLESFCTFAKAVKSGNARLGCIFIVARFDFDNSDIARRIRFFDFITDKIAESLNFRLESMKDVNGRAVLQDTIENAINAIRIATVVLDSEHVIKFANGTARQLLNINQKDLGVVRFRNLIHSEIDDETLAPLILSTQVTNDRRVDWKLKNGQRVSLFASTRPIFDSYHVQSGVILQLKELKRNTASPTAGSMEAAIGSPRRYYSFFTFDTLIGNNHAFLQAKHDMRLYMNTRESVLIIGEKGTGKRSLAHAAFNEFYPPDKPFITVECSCLSEEDERRFFMGIGDEDDSDNIGAFEQADGGLLLLHNFDHLSIDTQRLVVTVHGSQAFTRIDSNRTRYSNFRLFATTTETDFESLVESGQIDDELYYSHLMSAQIALPPLRERPDDLVPLTHSFIESYCTAKKIPQIKLDPDAAIALAEYSWPGNIAQLMQFVFHACAVCKKRTITADSFPRQMMTTARARNESEAFNRLVPTLSSMTDQQILMALQTTNGNETKAAKLLGISRTTIYRWKKRNPGLFD